MTQIFSDGFESGNFMNGQAEQEVKDKPVVMPSLAVQQQLGLLRLRLSDMMQELNLP